MPKSTEGRRGFEKYVRRDVLCFIIDQKTQAGDEPSLCRDAFGTVVLTESARFLKRACADIETALKGIQYRMSSKTCTGF